MRGDLRHALQELTRELRTRIDFRPGTETHPWVPGAKFSDGKLMTALVIAENVLHPAASEYPEHDKLTAIQVESQAQGQLLEWLAAHGVRLMTWYECDEPVTEDCLRCLHVSERSAERCACKECNGTHRVTRMEHRAGWIPDGRPIQRLLAEYHDIDQTKLEDEKRLMLDKQRELNERLGIGS